MKNTSVIELSTMTIYQLTKTTTKQHAQKEPGVVQKKTRSPALASHRDYLLTFQKGPRGQGL